jgi:riboflavin kinase/FMN adenylyltransferase
LQLVAGSGALARRLTNPVVTIGNFDGVHVGHRAIMEIVTARASARGGEAVVYTFDPHPRKVLQPEGAPGLLTTLEQKLERLEELGVDVVVVEPFDAAFASLSPERFVREILHGRLRPVEVYVGYDFRFGKDREGSMRLLAELGPHLGFSVTIVPEVTMDGRDVNSTRVRALLGEGLVEEAARLLDRPYTVWGRVIAGERRGRSLGFPTANLELENEVLPQAGVYAGHVRFLDPGSPPAGRRWPAVANLGHRPTFGGDARLLCEAHLLDFEGDVYGRRVELAFERRLRAERRFPDAEALRAQIAADADRARRLLGVAG